MTSPLRPVRPATRPPEGLPMRPRHSRRGVVPATAVLLLAAACGGDGTMTPAVPDQVVVSASSSTVPVGGQVQLSAAVRARGTLLPGGVSGWSSLNPAIATVSGSGVVTGVSRGSVTITANAGGSQGSASLLVAGVRTVQLSAPAVSLGIGESATITAAVDADPGVGSVTVAWSSSNPAVATVSSLSASSARVTAVSSGTTTLTASAQGVQVSTQVTVAVPAAISECRWPSPALDLVQGQTVAITPVVTRANSNVAVSFTYGTSAPAVASVSGTGVVTGVAPGNATLTVTCAGTGSGVTATTLSGTATATVRQAPVASVSVSPATTSLVVGGTQQLTAVARDSGGNALTGRAVTWSSGNTAVATVTQSGVVTAVAVGTATITATADGVNGTATTTVTAVPVTSVSVSPSTASLVVGGTQQLTATARDANGTVLTGRTATWGSSAPSVAVVSTAGVVTAVAAGTATITGTVDGVPGTAAITVTATPAAISALTVSPATSSLVTGQTVALTPAVTRANTAVNVSYEFSTSSTAVATVTGGGVVTAVAPGSATITVRATGTGTGVTSTTLTSTAAITVTPSVAFAGQFVRIEAGLFQMGATNGDTDELPVRTVRITQPFMIQTTEVTQGQWQAVMGTNPSFFTSCGSSCPVERVNFDEVQQFLTRLNEQDPGKGYRLPTEAEWEYAARAGVGGDYGGNGNLNDMGWWSGNSQGRTWPAGQKRANSWGLFDMHGNVWEWVADWYGSYSGLSSMDPTGPTTGTQRVLRGGAFGSGAAIARSAFRNEVTPTYRNADAGFRLVRNP